MGKTLFILLTRSQKRIILDANNVLILTRYREEKLPPLESGEAPKMRIEKVPGQQQNQQVRKAETVRDSKRTLSARKRDQVDLSEEANQTRTTELDLKAQLEKISDVREEKIGQMRAKIREGLYEREDVWLDIADEVLRSFGL